VLLADHTISSIALAVAVGGTAFSLALACVALLLARERPNAAQIRAMLSESNASVEAMLGEVTRSLERARYDALRSNGQSDPARGLDLEDVLTRTLAAARSVRGAQAAAVVLEAGDGGDPHVATSGLPPGLRYNPATLRLNGPDTRSVTVSYRHSPEEAAANGDLIRCGMAVPLHSADGESEGTLSVFWSDDGWEPGDEELALLEDLARRAAPAIETALRGRATRR
jgi:GAF domain